MISKYAQIRTKANIELWFQKMALQAMTQARRQSPVKGHFSGSTFSMNWDIEWEPKITRFDSARFFFYLWGCNEEVYACSAETLTGLNNTILKASIQKSMRQAGGSAEKRVFTCPFLTAHSGATRLMRCTTHQDIKIWFIRFRLSPCSS